MATRKLAGPPPFPLHLAQLSLLWVCITYHLSQLQSLNKDSEGASFLICKAECQYLPPCSAVGLNEGRSLTCVHAYTQSPVTVSAPAGKIRGCWRLSLCLFPFTHMWALPPHTAISKLDSISLSLGSSSFPITLTCSSRWEFGGGSKFLPHCNSTWHKVNS